MLYETCSEYTSRAQADLAATTGQPRKAVLIHREWLKLIDNETMMKEASEDVYSAYVLTRRYRLLSDALRVSDRKAEADEAESRRREVVDTWKKKLGGRQDAEALLAR